MDVNWFKSKQKLAGVTAEDIAKKMGRDRTVVSHIYAGRQQMSLGWAKVFSEVLDVSLSDVLERAGIADHPTAKQFQAGFSDSDAVAWAPKNDGDPGIEIARALGSDKPGVDVWQIRTDALHLQGILPDDFILVDTHAAERCGPGDIVIAQIYNWQTGEANTILRRYEPPVLVAANSNPDGTRVHVVDNNNVVIRGKVISSWRH